MIMKVLMVLTSHDQLGNTGKKTGFWLEELASPYFTFRDAGAQITLASPAGGRPPLDPKSNEPAFQTHDTRRFEADKDAMQALATTKKLSEIAAKDYDTVFFPGGHGPLWDLTNDRNALSLLEDMLKAGKPVALVCHSSGILQNVKTSAGRGDCQRPLDHRVHGFRGGRHASGGGRALPCRERSQGTRRQLPRIRRLRRPRRSGRPVDHRARTRPLRGRPRMRFSMRSTMRPKKARPRPDRHGSRRTEPAGRSPWTRNTRVGVRAVR